MSTTPSPFQDHAAPILQAEPTITDEQRANLWDVFHGAKDPAELAQKLAPIQVPDDLKHKLWTAKQMAAPAPAPVDKVAAAIKRVAAIDTQTLDVAESHPNVLKALTAAATMPEKEAGAAQDETSAAGKGKTADAAQKPALSPRADGQPHLPPIPEGHHRVLHSNGGIYDLPAENIEAARKLDPNMHVLNP